MSSLPSAIKAIGIRKNGDFDVIEELNDLPFPQQNEDEILIKVEYGGVNFIDTYERSGLYATTSFPKVLGQEASGTIVALPTAKDLLEDEEYKLRGFSVGDRVVALTPGSFAEYLSVHWLKVVKLPSHLNIKDATAVAVQGLTALTFATEAYPVKKGDTILVYTAAGGVGLILTQIALKRGATVIATVSSEEKARVVRDLGAQHVIVTSQQDTVDEVLRITKGEGVQAVFDGVGKDTFDDNFKITARKGTIVSLGNASGAALPFAPLKLAERNLTICRPKLFNYIYTPEEQREYATELFSLVDQGVIKAVIHGEYPFTAEGVQQAQKNITSRGTIGKLLIKVA